MILPPSKRTIVPPVDGATKIPATDIHPEAGWFFAPSTAGIMIITWGHRSQIKKPTHTGTRNGRYSRKA